MKWKIAVILGIVLMLAGLFGFLMASVALAKADEIPDNIQAPEGIELRLSPDNAQVRRQRQQAETVLFGSFLVGGLGTILVGTGAWMRKKATRHDS